MTLKHLTAITLLVVAPILVAAAANPEAAGTLTYETLAKAKTIVWEPVAGPVDTLPAVYDEVPAPKALTVHEWGTFTSIAGPDGKAMDWLPAGGPTDLPCFVALTDTSGLKSGGSDNQLGGRAGQGTVRMETPVLYFYSPREETVNVRVSFPHGLITEWYPATAKVGPASLWTAIKDLRSATGTIEWNNVKIMPGATESYPLEAGQSHYYAARRTGSDPLQVGNQKEKFLFYRGIASFQPPIAAVMNGDGTINVTNLGTEEIPSIILFENRGGRIGFTVVREFDKQMTMELPKLTSDFSSLQQSLEGILRSQGMYAAEAAAMVDTWKDTWFEQGTRIFYLVPSRTVDSILPLTIEPQPARIARAFVGRMEVITPATQDEVLAAIRTNDRSVLETYGRFLEPITKSFYSKLSEAEWSSASKSIASIRADYVAGVTACTKGKRAW